MSFMFMISAGVAMLLIVLNSTIGEKSMTSREASSAFECGFDPKSLARLPFSLHFFLIALVFLIFDVEITLLIPGPIILEESNMLTLSIIYTFFLLILIAGVLIEWVAGALNWNF